MKNRTGFRNFIRSFAERDGRWFVRLAGAQGSAMLCTMIQSNALLVVPETKAILNRAIGLASNLDFPEV